MVYNDSNFRLTHSNSGKKGSNLRPRNMHVTHGFLLQVCFVLRMADDQQEGFLYKSRSLAPAYTCETKYKVANASWFTAREQEFTGIYFEPNSLIILVLWSFVGNRKDKVQSLKP